MIKHFLITGDCHSKVAQRLEYIKNTMPEYKPEETAVIILENQSTYIVPIEMLPRNIEIDDFVIIDNGIVNIDPETDEKKELLRNALEELLK